MRSTSLEKIIEEYRISTLFKMKYLSSETQRFKISAKNLSRRVIIRQNHMKLSILYYFEPEKTEISLFQPNILNKWVQ